MRFAIFPLRLSKVLRLPRKSDARSYGALYLSHSIIFPKLKIWCSKMQPLSGNQCPDLLTSLMNMSFVLRHAKCIFPDSLQMFHGCQRFWNCYKTSHFAHFWQGAESLAWPGKTTSELSKVVRACGVLDILTWKYASLQNSVHFLRSWCALYILTSKCALRHNGVQLFISHLASWLHTRRFSEPTFWPFRTTNHWKKNTVSRLSYLFAHLHLLSSHSFSSLILSLLLFSSLTLPTSAFHLSIFSEVWLLNFLRICDFICVCVYLFNYLFTYGLYVNYIRQRTCRNMTMRGEGGGVAELSHIYTHSMHNEPYII